MVAKYRKGIRNWNRKAGIKEKTRALQKDVDFYLVASTKDSVCLSVQQQTGSSLKLLSPGRRVAKVYGATEWFKVGKGMCKIFYQYFNLNAE